MAIVVKVKWFAFLSVYRDGVPLCGSEVLAAYRLCSGASEGPGTVGHRYVVNI